MIDKMQVKGTLRIFQTRERYPIVGRCFYHALNRGLLKQVHETSNMFVDIGLEAVCALLGGGRGNPTVGGGVYGPTTFGDLRIEWMYLTEEVSPTASAASDTYVEGTPTWLGNVAGPPTGNSVLVVSYPAKGEVVFDTVIPPTEKNGSVFTEEALFTSDGRMLARTTFSYEKEAAFGLQFQHTLSFERIG